MQIAPLARSTGIRACHSQTASMASWIIWFHLGKVMAAEDEKALQEGFAWARSQMFADYNGILGYYQAKACLEHARGSSLLDMPCGDGTLTALLAPAFKQVVGVDASSQHLAL